MAAVKDRDTTPEMMLRRELHALGLRYRIHPRDVPGRPDLVNRRRRVAVFVDGDFWHGNPDEWQRRGFTSMADQFPLGKRDRWTAKLQRNVQRDREVNAELTARGWRVMRVWESEIMASPIETAKRIEIWWRREKVQGDAVRRGAE